MIVITSICLILLLSVAGLLSYEILSASEEEGGSKNDHKQLEPWVRDLNLKVEKVSEGLQSPASFAFLGLNDILVLERYDGKIHRIMNGTLVNEPLFDLAVSNKFERGLLGIAVDESDDENKPRYVFLSYTESPTDEDGTDICPVSYDCESGNDPLGNRLYRYELQNNSQLVNPKLLLDLPSTPGPSHNGGKVVIGPDNYIYVNIGDVLGYRNDSTKSKVLNFVNGTSADGRSGILRISHDGKVVGDGILGTSYPLNLYYAYGIRNSFGIDFDPLTGNLWDTENGPDYGDEINLVEPGFNSGWNKVQGIWKPFYNETRGGDFIAGHELGTNYEDSLEIFGGKGNYSSPEFIWYNTVAPTGLTFFNSSKFGKEYENDMFVGDYKNGNLYKFDLNKNRTGLLLFAALKDGIVDTSNEFKSVLFGEGFGGITDLKLGPDGYLYVLSIGNGVLYRIAPK